MTDDLAASRPTTANNCEAATPNFHERLHFNPPDNGVLYCVLLVD